MKSKHLAKADFLRQLKEMTAALYELGDFTSVSPERALLSKKIEGFIEAGLIIEVASRAEIVGESVAWLSKQMGHTDVGFTLRTYARFIEDDRNDAGSRFGSWLSNQRHPEKGVSVRSAP